MTQGLLQADLQYEESKMQGNECYAYQELPGGQSYILSPNNLKSASTLHFTPTIDQINMIRVFVQ